MFHKIRHNERNLYLIFIASCSITAFFIYIIYLMEEKRSHELFHERVHDTTQLIEVHMEHYEDILESTAALFDASENVSAEEWEAFVSSVIVNERHSAILSLRYHQKIFPDEIVSYEAQNLYGSTHHIWPVVEAEVYYPITYLSPMDEMSKKIVGFNPASDPKFYHAMMKAARIGNSVITEKVISYQNNLPAIEIYFPLYAKNVSVRTEADRVKALSGFVSASFGLKAMIEEMIGEQNKFLDYEIYEGKDQNFQNLLYRSSELKRKAKFYASHKIQVDNHTWQINFYSKPDFDESVTGEKIWLVIIGGVLFNILLGYVLLKQIQNRRELEAKSIELSENQRRLQTILQSSIDGIYITDMNGNVVQYSQSFLDILGYEAQDIQHFNVVDWEVGMSKETVLQILQNTSKEPISYLSKNQRKDGSVFDAEIHASSIILDGKPHIYASLRDVSDLIEAQNGVKRESERLKLATDVTGIGIWMFHLKDNTFTADQKMLELYEMDIALAEKHLPFEEWTSRCHSEDVEDAVKALDEAIKNGTKFDKVFRIVVSSGIKHIHGVGIMQYDQKGNPTGMIGTNRDVTEEKSFAMELQEAKEEAERANEAKSNFVANMSHEIRTPLNGVIGLIDLTLKTELNEVQRQFLTKAEFSGHALLHIINDILDYSKIEAGKLHLETIPFSLRSIVEKTLNLFSVQAEKKNISINVELDKNIPSMLMGDPFRLMQVITNLVGNAVKFTENGKVTISVAHRKVAKRHELFFSVSDTGIGMTSEQVMHLFQPFTQADASFTRKYGGTGLGLTISKQIVEMMEGVINVSSHEGEGSRFSFTAVFDDVPPTAISETDLLIKEEQNTHNLLGVSVLLAEDNEINQIVAVERLKALGMNYHIANNGAEAVEMVKVNDYDVILMDLQMPVMDGFEATRQIHQIPGKESVPIIALSAAVLEEDRKRTMEAGMAGHLAKPIDMRELTDALLECIASKP